MTLNQARGVPGWVFGLGLVSLIYYCRSTQLSSWPGLPSRLSMVVQKVLSPFELCHVCHKLMNSFISFSASQNSDWIVFESNENIITVRQHHHDNTVRSLRNSSISGCKLCNLFYQSLQRGKEDLQDDEIYSIFFWGRLPLKKELLVARGNSDQFLRHVSQWVRPVSLIVYERRPSSRVKDADMEKPPSLLNLPEQYPTSRDAIDFVKTMFRQCVNGHIRCARASGPLPKRVLDLGPKSELSSIRLHISHGESREYATLSYSWGGAGKRLLTETASIKARCENINIVDFPKTLRDGIVIAKTLGFRYLWIDSLCIVQDDDNDWAYQGTAMTNIYGYSSLNISASSSMSSDAGFLHRLPEFGIRLRHIKPPAGMAINNIYVGPKLQTLDLEALEVSRRGWIFQERLVTSATVHYTVHGIVWECVEHTQLQHVQPISTAPWKAQWKNLLRPSNLPQQQEDDHRQADSKDFRSWHDWVSVYSNRELFEWTDKLPAIAGVAREFASIFSLTYCAGLWTENLRQDLLWSRHNKVVTLTRSTKYVAPSWSWASVNGSLEYREVTLSTPVEKLDLKIMSHFISEEFPGSFGKVAQGHLIVRGLLQAVVIDKSSHLSIMKKPHQACGVREGFKNNFNVLCMLDEFEQTKDPYESLWCLRVGSFQVSGRRGHMYLLLQWTPGHCTFRRVGFAETDPWIDGSRNIEDSGAFISPAWTQLKLI